MTSATVPSNFPKSNPELLAPVRLISTLMIICAVLFVAPELTFAQSTNKTESGRSATSPEDAAMNYFGDVELIDQDGRPQRLYSDLFKGKVVIINPFFSTCTGVCPTMTRNLEAIQDWLGVRLGKDVHMISITVDPGTDTPPKLKEYAAQFHAKPGWYFLGGTKENTEAALRKLGQYVAEKNDHSTLLIIGNLRTGLWKKALAMARPADLIQIVESVIDDKPPKE